MSVRPVSSAMQRLNVAMQRLNDTMLSAGAGAGASSGAAARRSAWGFQADPSLEAAVTTAGTFTNAASVWTFSAKPKKGNRLQNPSGLRIFRRSKLTFKPFLSNAAPALPDNSDLASAGAAGTAGAAPAP